jgi:hypothetical protein
VGFTSNTANQRIIYNGPSGRTFYVQTSFALSATATTILSFETRRYNSSGGIVQGSGSRWSLGATQIDSQDFNLFQMNSGDYIEIWGAVSTTTNVVTFSNTFASTGLTLSPKPIQIFINEVLTPI